MMNRRGGCVALTFLVLLSCVHPSPAADADVAPGYAGFEAPGNVPTVFAPRLISTAAYEFAITFTPDMRELYLTRREDPGPNRILVARVDGDSLRPPVPASFSNENGEYEACVSPDGTRIYFKQNGRIGFCTLTDDGWSAVQPLPPEVNQDGAMALWVDSDGNLYFTRNGGLVVVRPDGDGYREAEPLGSHFQLPAGDAAHGFVAPDGSYVIFDSQLRSEGKGRADLYLSRRNPDGSWASPANMEVLNTAGTEMCANISPDGRFLFFSRDGDVYWVDASVIEQYR